MSCSNQLPKLPQGTDRRAWFRRVVLVEFLQTFPRDPAFKEAVLAERDAIFSNIVNSPYVPIIAEGTDIDAYTRAVGDRWDYWAHPVVRMCERLFGRGVLGDELEKDLCADLVRDLLDEDGIHLDMNAIKTEMTIWMRTVLKVCAVGRARHYAPAQVIAGAVAAGGEDAPGAYARLQEERAAWGAEGGEDATPAKKTRDFQGERLFLTRSAHARRCRREIHALEWERAGWRDGAMQAAMRLYIAQHQRRLGQILAGAVRVHGEEEDLRSAIRWCQRKLRNPRGEVARCTREVASLAWIADFLEQNAEEAGGR